MQTAVAFKTPLARAATRATRATSRVVVCRAQQQSVFSKAAAAGVSVPALLAAHPAFALVDERMAGEGTGKIFGINDGALFWNMLAIFSSVWAVYYLSQKDLDGGDTGDDSGLSL
ncbi:hypothetical protein Ndes2526B_g03131 [Nannochloris sp. 'desiccata']|nr:hypothetical protein KSW81_006635 [Chlorella desiccata (nom. nud.)]KAH7622305.1 putative Photosystem II reaction center W protein, chloroplastic [Chlorella desiccata (nom. nud.)]